MSNFSDNLTLSFIFFRFAEDFLLHTFLINWQKTKPKVNNTP